MSEKTSNFISKSIVVHGKRYSYDKSKYIKCGTKLIITCPTHGDFKQTPSNHLGGRGCPKCSINKRTLTNELFVERSLDKHRGLYSYDKTKYTNSRTKVIITCPIHGDFEQAPQLHLSGYGCRGCSKRRYLTTEVFISESKAVFINEGYDYSKSSVVRSNEEVIITCPKHGDFLRTPSMHIRGAGCQSCLAKRRLTKDEFMKKATEKHGFGKYDYSNINYLNNSTRVTIRCPKHGEFKTRPTEHLRGRGCRGCYDERQRMPFLDFAKKASKVHNNKYQYKADSYKMSKSKLIIICPIHGEFVQMGCDHLNGRGCQICCASVGEQKIANFLNAKKIKFHTQKTFKGLADKSLLRVDFWIPSVNAVVEFDGEQHYRAVNFGGMSDNKALRAFQGCQHRDKIKNNFFKTRGIKLLRIPYNEVQNTEEHLKKLLFLD